MFDGVFDWQEHAVQLLWKIKESLIKSCVCGSYISKVSARFGSLTLIRLGFLRVFFLARGGGVIFQEKLIQYQYNFIEKF